MRLAVVIPTHNPRRAYLDETLRALKAQTLPTTAWDLVVVDNASREPLGEWLDLGWHPTAKVVREYRAGIVHARRAGLMACDAVDWIVWVDDDNVLRPDYLGQAMALAREFPRLGAFGGSLVPRFEVEPEAWTRPWWPYLALSGVAEPQWAEGPLDLGRIPPGAGLCIRRDVVAAWVRHLESDRRFQLLGVKGKATFRGDDTDLVWECFVAGLQVARFPVLALDHLMPERRFTEDALVDLYLKSVLSIELLVGLRTGGRWKREGLPGLLRQAIAIVRLPRRERRFAWAEVSGVLRARWMLVRLGSAG